MKDAVGIVVEGGNKCPIIKERTELPMGIIVAVVGRKIYDDLNAVGVSSRDQIVKGSKGVVDIAKVFFNALEIPCCVAVVGGGRMARAIGNVEIQIVHRRRDPDGSSAQSFDVRHFLLNPGQIATPIKSPVSLGRIKKT